MKKNLSIIFLSGLLINSSAFALRITLEDIEPKSFEEFKKPQTPPKVTVVSPAKVVPVPAQKAEPVKAPATKVEAVETQNKSAPQTHNNKTLVIGDSLSSLSGKFGKGILETLGKNGNDACLFAVSGSSFDQWTGSRKMKNLYGSSKINYQNGKLISEVFEVNDSRPEKWNLESLLASHSCGNKEKKFTHLVVQLGSNPGKLSQLEIDLNKISELAKSNGIQDIKFILPPDKRDFSLEKTRSTIRDYASKEKRIKISCFETVAISKEDFLKDGIHFWNTNSEKNWTTKFQKWNEEPSPQFVIEKAINENSHKNTVSN